MSDQSPPPRTWMRKSIRVVLGTVVGIVALAVALAALVHTPPVRREVLRQVVATLERRYGIRLDASSLDYNLFRPVVTLTGVRVAATHALDRPFLEADRIEAKFPWAVVRGAFSLRSVVAGTLTIRVYRTADGTTNLPRSQGPGGGEPPRVPVGRLDVGHLTLDVTDDVSQVAILLPDIALAAVSETGGTVTLQQPGRLRWRDISTTLSTLGGGLTFDGRRVGLRAFRAVTDEGTVDVAGTVDALVSEPAANLTLSATADAARASRWAALDPAPGGTISATGTVGGPLATLAWSLRVRSPRVQYRGFTFTNADADVQLDPDRLRLPRVEAGFSGGAVRLNGESVFDSAVTTFAASWSGVDTQALTRVVSPTLSPRPSARSRGTASLRGTGADLDGWELDMRSTLDAGTTARDQLGVGGTLRGGFSRGGWTLVGDVTAGTIPLTAQLGGRFNADDAVRSTLTGTASSNDIDMARAIETLVQAGLMSAPGDPVAGTASIAADLSGTLDAPRFQAQGHATGVAAAGLSGFDLDATSTGTFEETAFDVDGRQGSLNHIMARGTVWPARQQLDARVDGQVADLASLGIDAAVGGAVDVQVSATGPFDALAFTGTARAHDVRYEDVAIGTVDATLEADAARARVNATLADLSATLTADLQRATRQAHVEIHGTQTDIARLMPPGATTTLTGSLSFTAIGDGSLDRWEDGTVTVEVTQLAARAGELPIDLVTPARASYAGGTVDVASLDARVGALLVSIAGRLPARATTAPVSVGEALSAVMVGTLDQVIETAREAGLRDTPRIAGSGPVAVRARITGSIEQPVADANLEFGPGSVQVDNLPPASPLQVRARIDRQQIEILQATGEWQGSCVSAGAIIPLGLLAPYLPAGLAASLPRADQPASLTLRAEPLTPRVLEPFVGPDTLAQVQGSISASAELRAASLDIHAIEGEIRLDTVNLTIAGLPVTQTAVTRLVAGAGVARVATWEWRAPESLIRIGGQIGLEDWRVALLLGGRVDMRLLAPLLAGSGVTTTGSVEPRIAVMGSLTDPLVEGEILLADADVRVGAPRIAITDLNGLAMLSPRALNLTRLDGRINGGTLTGAGRLDYGGGVSAPGRLTAAITGMALEYPAGLRSEINAELAIALDTATPGADSRARLTGTVTVARGGYREPIGVVTGLLAALRTRRVNAGPAGEASALDRLDLDVRVVTDDDLVVRNNVAQAQLGADVRLIGTASAPSLSGRATLREGGALTFGRNRYTIDSGTIDFSNPVTIEPNLNVQAHTRAGGEDIELTLTGTPETLDVGLSSSSAPELGEADVASLLLTGRRLEQIPGAEARIVGEEVLGYLSGDVLGVAGRAVGLDVIRLGGVEDEALRRDSASIATATDPTSRMTFVKSLGEQLEVTLSQSLRSGDAQTWIVDYLPVRRLDVRFISRDDSLRSYQLRHDVSIGNGPSTVTVARETRPVQRVAAIVLEGMLGVSEAELRNATHLSVGDTFDSGEWQLDRDRVEAVLDRASFVEARVSTSVTERQDGVALLYRINSGPRTALAVNGASLSSSTTRTMRDVWRSSVSDDALQEEVRTLVSRAMADDGHLQPKVEVSVDTATPGQKTLHVNIQPGERTARRTVRIASDDPDLDAALEREVGRARLLDLAVHAPSALQQELSNALRTRGYLRATVRVAEPRIENGTAVWVVTIRPDEPFVLGDVHIEGGGASAATVQGDLDSGEFIPGARFIPGTVERTRSSVLAAFHQFGYAQARVTTQLSIDDTTHRVGVTFVVEEGLQQMLQQVTIAGNREIRDDVITRALALPVNQPLPANAWLQARTRVFQTGLFRRVDVSAEPIEDAATAATSPMAVRVAVQEWPALRLRYGLEVSEQWQDLDPLKGRNLTPGLSADLTRRSLFGRAVTIGVSGEYRQRERANRLFVGTPTLWGRAVESLVTVQQVRTELAGEIPFIRNVASVSWEQRTRLGRTTQIGYSYRFERNHTYDPNPSPDPFFPIFDITENVARLIGTAAYDTRNDPLNAAQGLLASSGLEYAPEALGSASGVHFIRSLNQFYYFRPWHGVVLASAARVGLAAGLGGVALIPTERFRAGGARSLRGVEEDGLGPRSVIFGDVIGGNAMLLLNQELRFPLYRWLRGVAFTDLGNVFARPTDIRLGDLVGSTGAGLRLVTPFGLLRVDYGKRWSPAPGQASGRWSFGIGQAF